MSLPRTNPILLIFLSRACKGSYSSSSSDCTPIAVCRCCYETMPVPFFPSFFFFSLPLSTLLLPLQPPMRRLLTLCIRCNRVLVFRQSAFSKNGCVVEWFFFFFFFSHSTLGSLGSSVCRAHEGNSAWKSLGCRVRARKRY